ncbi:MAG: hypothetical protein J0M25_00575 [Flavobacteriales bacterium]|nr:hypothetical protein [Flavobacteriales bacterium]
MPIIINDNNSNLFPVVEAALNNLKFEPQKFFKFKTMEDASSNNFTIDAFFPRYDTLSGYSAFSGFLVEITFQFTSIPFVAVEGGSSWSGSLGASFTDFFKRTVNFSFINTDLLSAGNYSCLALFNVKATNAQGQIVTIQSKNFEINQEVMAFDAPRLEVVAVNNPMVFYYSGTIPPSQSFFVFSNQNISVDNPNVDLLNVAVTNLGLYKKYTVTVTSEVESLPVNAELTLEITDEFAVLPPVSFLVNIDLMEESEGLQVNPAVISITRSKGVSYNNGSVPVFVFSSLPWQIVSGAPNWLIVNGGYISSYSTIYIDVNTDLLAEAGNYSGIITLSNGSATATITVNLTLLDYILNPFQSGKHYFTKDLDYLQFSSAVDNTYMEITVNSEFYKRNNFSEVFTFERKYSVPLLFGKGDFHLGNVIHELFDQTKPGVNLGLNFAYKPARISFSVQEKYFDSDDEIDGQLSVSDVYFILGKSPFITSYGLGILSKREFGLHRITPNSLFGISYMSLPNSEIIIKKNGNVIETISPLSFTPNAILHSYLKYLKDLKVGDLIEFFVTHQSQNRAVRYLVHAEGLNSANFVFINQNGVFDAIELTGRYRVNSNYTHTFFSKFKDLFSADEKLRTLNRQSFVVNTGLMTLDEAALVDALIKSELIYLIVGSENPILLTCVSSRVLVNDSNENSIAYDLEFNLQTDSDAVFYIR